MSEKQKEKAGGGDKTQNAAQAVSSLRAGMDIAGYVDTGQRPMRDNLRHRAN